MNITDYFDLTVAENDISKLSIKKKDNFNCNLVDEAGVGYAGFLLAKSTSGNAFTVCDINFQKSLTDNKFPPRLTFRRTNKKFEEKKVGTNSEVQRISFHRGEDGYREFWKMIAFLCKFKDLVDVGEFHDSYIVVDSSAFILQFKTQQEAQKINELSRLISEGNLTEDNIKEALQGTRKITLGEFEKLLKNKDYWKTYQEKFSDIKGAGEEAIWHHFLKKNDWILGLNADVRFLRDLLSEVEVGISNTDGTGSPQVDFLGVSDYTVLIELKTSNTPIFTEKKKETGRANTWSFSSDFIDGVSQCLGQKFDWEKNHNQKKLVDENNNALDQNQTRTVDPKSIFLIGNKANEMSEESQNTDVLLKRDTFQRFRRNNRNLEILTFDELYERAYFIVHNRKLKSLALMEEKSTQEENVNSEDLPF